MSLSLKEQFPYRLIIGNEDCTFLLDDSFTHSSVDPGGFEAASFQIPKDMPATLRGQYVRMDCGLRVAFEGRISEVQRSLGNKTQITCQGYGALFNDLAGSMVFVDRDLTQWQSPSTPQQIVLSNDDYQLGSTEVAADATTNLPALVQEIDDSWVSPYRPICQAWYDSGPQNLIASVYYNLANSSNALGGDFTNNVFLSSDDIETTTESTANLNDGTGTGYFTPATDYRFAMAQFFYSATPAGSQGAQYLAAWRNMAVYGNHGLTGQGSDPVGFYPSQLATWVIDQVPGLQLGVIPTTDSTGYIMPHSVYYTAVGFDQMIGDFATAAGWHWGVWEDLSPLTGTFLPRCDFRPRPTLGNWTAFCHRSDTTQCDIREDISNQYNNAVISFTNVDGTNGAATASIDNPILDEAGIQTRTLTLNGGTMTNATAALFGQLALLYSYNEARVAGSIQIDQAITGPSGPMPPWLLRPGIDRLRVGDLPSFDAWGTYNDVPIQRMEMSGSSGSGFSTSIEVGVGASLIETLQSRLSAATALAGEGGS